MNDEQQLLGSPYELEWRGKTLRFASVVEGVIGKCVAAGKLAAKIEHEQNLNLFYSAPDMETQIARQQANDEFNANMITGRWKWGGDLQEQWRKGPDGMTVFISALLEFGGTPLSRPDIEALVREKQTEMAAVVMLAQWDLNFPNEKRPAELTKVLTGLLKGTKKTASHSDQSDLSTSKMSTPCFAASTT